MKNLFLMEGTQESLTKCDHYFCINICIKNTLCVFIIFRILRVDRAEKKKRGENINFELNYYK